MEEHVLDEDFFYEAADIQDKSFPIENIKYVGISVQPFTDISFILKAPNLEIVTLRLCSFKTFPQELFNLPKLKTLDLSGNAIEVLPDKELFSTLKNLRSINLQDNNIIELTEVFKISGAPNLQQLILSGNVCLSQNDSFNLITKEIKKLIILNDLIITSQHRAFIDNLAIFDNNSCLSSSKTDDFFFLYVRYMHAPSNERYVRRSNTQQFCLNRVIRKYSAVEKIQSVFRGFVNRVRYKKLIHASYNLQSFLKLWFHRRLTAANRIRCCFLYYRTRQIIKRIRAARKIQSTWRRKIARERTRIEVFDNNGIYGFIIPQSDLERMKNYLKLNNLSSPKSITETKYKLIRKREAKVVPFPGSPTIYYNCDDSLIVRICHNHSIPKNASIWCSHDHSATKGRIKVTNYGINYTRQCPFASIPMIKNMYSLKSIKLSKYPLLIKFTFENREKFSDIVNSILGSQENFIIYPERTLKFTSAQITIQSSTRTFIEHLKNFREIKQKAIESRALSCIRYCFKTIKIHRCVSHISNTIKYYNTLPSSFTFYIPYQYYSSIISMRKEYDVDFGYSSDKSLVIDKNFPEGFVKKIIPAGQIVFALNDLPSIVNFGLISSKAQSSMFSTPIPLKYIKRYRIMRLTYANPSEARCRLALFAWMTNKFNVIMTERDVLEFCSANAIHSCWRGYASRRRLAHILVQRGSNADHSSLFRKINFKGRDKDHFRKNSLLNELNSNSNENDLNSNKLSKDPVESIHELRNDYRPWKKQLEEYRDAIFEENKYKTNTKNSTNKSLNENEMSQSTLNVDLLTANNFPGVEIKTIKLPAKSALNFNRNNQVKNLKTEGNKGRHSNIEKLNLNNQLLKTAPNVSKTENPSQQKPEIKPEMDSSLLTTDLLLNQPNSSSNSMTVDSLLNQPNQNSSLLTTDSLLNQPNQNSNLLSINSLLNSNRFTVESPLNQNEPKISSNLNSDSLLNKTAYKPNFSSPAEEAIKTNEEEDEDNFDSNFDISKVKKKVSNDFSFRPKAKPKVNSSFSQLSLSAFAKKINSEEKSNKGQTKAIENSLLSSVEDEVDENPRLMAPFFTGSPKRKVRSIKKDEDKVESDQKELFPKELKCQSSRSAFSIFDNAADLRSIIREREEKKKAEEEEQKDDNEENVEKKKSAQKSNNFLQEMVKKAFTKLSRLHHLGLIIASSAVVDDSIEKNRLVALEAREQLEKKRAETEMKKKFSSNETHNRAKIEHMMLVESLEDQKSLSQKEKSKRVKGIKEEAKMKREKFIANKNFGQNFVNMARMISHKAEMSKKSLGSKSSLMASSPNSLLNTANSTTSFLKYSGTLNQQKIIQKNAVSSLRKSNIENRNALKEFNSQQEIQKRNLTLLDKINLEKRRKKNLELKSSKLNSLYEEKRKDKERRKLLKEKYEVFKPPQIIPQVVEDETENAINNIAKYMGDNLGIIESHLLVDIINNIIH